MSEIGYYRYKTVAAAERVVNFTVNFVNVASKTIIPLTFCTGDLRLKYLDKDGQYRFQPFEKYSLVDEECKDKDRNLSVYLNNWSILKKKLGR